MNLKIWKTKIKLGWFLLLDPLKKFIFCPEQRRDICYAWYYKHSQIKERVILYEAFYGRGLLCNPYAIFQELIQHPEYSSYQHVWVLDQRKDHLELMKKYKRKYPNVSFVQFESREYLRQLASAKYLVNNFTFPSYFIKKTYQVYINTWHGIPLKTLGYDEPEGALAVSNTVRNFLHADYLISANPFLTDIYINAFKQKGISAAKIIEEGYPRLDILVNTTKEDIYLQLRNAGVDIWPEKKIILYAPTWRGGYADPDCSLDGIRNLKETLEKIIDMDVYQIFVKVHQVVYSKIKEKLTDFSYVIPAAIDANAVLSVTDILISDYSSIYFDFLATGNPVLFYITDLEQYVRQRGMYFSLEDLPGPYTDSLAVLGTWINNIDKVFKDNRIRYDRVRKWCCNYDIGSITKKVVQAVFMGQTEGIRIIKCTDQKKKVLISRGPMQINGISTALCNLLKQFDYESYDVTVLVKPPADEQQKEQILKLDSRARVMVIQGGMISGIAEEIRNNFYTQTNVGKRFHGMFFPKRIYGRECRRLFGRAEFDCVIDYDGYDIFFAALCLAHKNAKSVIWLHSDMLFEYRQRFHWLERVFALYPEFDQLISCSRQIMEVNRKNLSGYVSREKFGYAKNCVDFVRVHKGSEEGRIVRRQNSYYYAVSEGGSPIIHMKLIPLQYEVPGVEADEFEEVCTDREKIRNGTIRFVNVARLSAGKNQAELIKGFARLMKECPDVMLYIIGEGPEREMLENLIARLKLQGRVILTGALANPFGLMRQCDCFILPSLYEGQPLTVFEARALHLPVILSDFASAEGSRIEDGQYMVHMDADSIYEGLRAYFLGKISDAYTFCDEKYNQEAYGEFVQAVFNVNTEER